MRKKSLITTETTKYQDIKLTKKVQGLHGENCKVYSEK